MNRLPDAVVWPRSNYLATIRRASSPYSITGDKGRTNANASNDKIENIMKTSISYFLHSFEIITLDYQNDGQIMKSGYNDKNK